MFLLSVFPELKDQMENDMTEVEVFLPPAHHCLPPLPLPIEDTVALSATLQCRRGSHHHR